MKTLKFLFFGMGISECFEWIIILEINKLFHRAYNVFYVIKTKEFQIMWVFIIHFYVTFLSAFLVLFWVIRYVTPMNLPY